MCKQACLYVFIQENYTKAHVLMYFIQLVLTFIPPPHHFLPIYCDMSQKKEGEGGQSISAGMAALRMAIDFSWEVSLFLSFSVFLAVHAASFGPFSKFLGTKVLWGEFCVAVLWLLSHSCHVSSGRGQPCIGALSLG